MYSSTFSSKVEPRKISLLARSKKGRESWDGDRFAAMLWFEGTLKPLLTSKDTNYPRS